MKTKLSKTAIHTLMATTFAAGMSMAASDAYAEHHEKMAETEKCYGVVKAGMNDCANAAGTHSCAAMASVDADGGEWLSLPKGVCEKLAGGSLEPVMMDEEHHEEDGHAMEKH